jgi:hypothetical protein
MDNILCVLFWVVHAQILLRAIEMNNFMISLFQQAV